MRNGLKILCAATAVGIACLAVTASLAAVRGGASCAEDLKLATVAVTYAAELKTQAAKGQVAVTPAGPTNVAQQRSYLTLLNVSHELSNAAYQKRLQQLSAQTAASKGLSARLLTRANAKLAAIKARC